jgi:16S rRNA (guanine527-N7)-methyltransferase
MHINSTELTETLIKRATEINIELSEIQIKQLICYIDQLQKWNSTYNLTAITDPELILEYHIIDSLQVVKYLREYNNILDLGTGAGLPGIILAIDNPNRKITLVDKSKKKISFLKHICYQLDLDPTLIKPIHTRIDPEKNFESNINKFDAIISRAVTQIDPFVNLTEHLLQDDGHMFLMKGTKDTINTETNIFMKENKKISKLKWQLKSIELPNLLINNEQRHLIEIYK